MVVLAAAFVVLWFFLDAREAGVFAWLADQDFLGEIAHQLFHVRFRESLLLRIVDLLYHIGDRIEDVILVNALFHKLLLRVALMRLRLGGLVGQVILVGVLLRKSMTTFVV